MQIPPDERQEILQKYRELQTKYSAKDALKMTTTQFGHDRRTIVKVIKEERIAERARFSKQTLFDIGNKNKIDVLPIQLKLTEDICNAVWDNKELTSTQRWLISQFMPNFGKDTTGLNKEDFPV